MTRVALANMRHTLVVAAAVITAVASQAIPRASRAQSALKVGTEIVVAPAFQSWSFAKPIPIDSLQVVGTTQISLPFSVTLPLHPRWSTSITGAVASSKLDATGDNGTVTRSFTGLSDIRVRANGRLLGDGVQLTVGLNLPTGAVRLSPEQNDVLRVVAAPALNAQVPIAGNGLGGTVGIVLARTISNFAWALGAGLEKRGSYAPLDAQIAGLDARTELEPGSAAHFSVGMDGLLGAHRLSAGFVADVFGTDEVRLVSNENALSSQQYQLGPTMSASVQLLLDNPRIRNFTVRVSERYRSGFKDGAGNQVDGSSGNYLELGASGLLGGVGRPSLLLGAEVRQHSGLTVDKGLIGAGLTAFGATVGVSIPRATLEWRPTVRASTGSVRSAFVTSGMTALTVGLTVIAR